ncbi:hypothetical protein SAMN05216370_0479 [Pseudomonas peli]|jgi:hypothetical protein|uniref:Phosphodiesterase n=1 Tax=Pseudomonas peli TaxID=592361 RepID=A0AB37Z2U2_9PSED|nr:phosphodiesterase [Pseudomonas peli]NMZ69247.1 phosphodiesterase [Pseudomonas peli]SCW33132.1 hypothetical protein SAMN05216370_0479 [Pseudomonas peli]
MIVLSHRGYWLERSERNQRIAFERSFQLGYGTETDLRDAGGEIVISHDVATGDELTLAQALDIYRLYSDGVLPLALNIKADGLAGFVKKALESLPGLDAFVFDMAVPDMRSYFEAGIPVFTRMSEAERQPVWLDYSAGVWLDSFGPTWYDEELVGELLSTGKRVCVVSSELHMREPQDLWSMLTHHAAAPNLMLCTDRPEQARAYFRL